MDKRKSKNLADWQWTSGVNKNRNANPNQKTIESMSMLVYVTNFPKATSITELWRICESMRQSWIFIWLEICQNKVKGLLLLDS